MNPAHRYCLISLLPSFFKTYCSNIHVANNILPWCASRCEAECRICTREVAASNLSLGYFAPRSTQPSIPLGSVNVYQLYLGRQRQVWLIPIADELVSVQVKLWDPLRTRAIPERFCSGDSLRWGYYQVYGPTFFLYLCISNHIKLGNKNAVSSK